MISIDAVFVSKRNIIKIFTHLELCLATATHNFKWVENTHISFI